MSPSPLFWNDRTIPANPPPAAILSEQTHDSLQERVLYRLPAHRPADCLSQLVHESHR
jgi:microcystin degradation protein MlrC